MFSRLDGLLPGLTQEQRERFFRYGSMLIEWNKTRNLTAITDPDEIAEKHFYDSLAALPLLKGTETCIDVGTGAGFPGIPLLIMQPGLRLTLLDALQKRIDFLEAVLKELGLGAACIHMRAEDAGRDASLRGRFDVAVTRAVAGLPVLTELTVPLLKTGGKSIAYKGNAEEELLSSAHAFEELRCRAEAIPVAADYGNRMLIVITKWGDTPKKYPRKAGTPSKQPL